MTIEAFAREVERRAAAMTGDPASVEAFHRFYGPELAKLRRQAGLMPVTINGSRAKGLKAGYFRAALRDGSWGWLQRRTDDCLSAAVASLLQIPMHQVPDLHIDRRLAQTGDLERAELEVWGEMLAWAERRGLTIVFHSTPPVWAKRWIGIVPQDGAFSDHCLVMAGRDALFDPSQPLPPGRNEPVSLYADPADVAVGITIEKR